MVKFQNKRFNKFFNFKLENEYGIIYYKENVITFNRLNPSKILKNKFLRIF